MTLWTAARRHWALMIWGLVLGIVLAAFSVFQVENVGGRPKVSLRSPGNYGTSVTAVIDTADFGLGSSDTDVAKLALVAPTYAEFFTSQPVLRRAQARMPKGTVIQKAESGGRKDADAEVSADAVGQSPLVKVTVEAKSKQLAVDTAVAVVGALQAYLSESQQTSATPSEKRLTVTPMGLPSEPQLVSNRQRELAIVLLCLPLAVALGLAYRVETSSARTAGPGVVEVPAAPVEAPSAVSESTVERMRAF